jgi:hypothetical protein
MKGENKFAKKVDYALGKIYAIRSKTTPFYYVGSTAETDLNNRLKRHISDYISYMNQLNSKGYMTSFFVIEQDDAEIVLLQNFPCKNKIELKDREAHHIRLGGENVVNKNIPNRTRKQWNAENPERMKGYRIKYRAKKKALKENQVLA